MEWLLCYCFHKRYCTPVLILSWLISLLICQILLRIKHNKFMDQLNFKACVPFASKSIGTPNWKTCFGCTFQYLSMVTCSTCTVSVWNIGGCRWDRLPATFLLALKWPFFIASTYGTIALEDTWTHTRLVATWSHEFWVILMGHQVCQSHVYMVDRWCWSSWKLLSTCKYHMKTTN